MQSSAKTLDKPGRKKFGLKRPENDSHF